MNKTTIERLSSFARLWGQVYLFHPALSTGDADLLPPTIAAIDAIVAARDKVLETVLAHLKKTIGQQPSAGGRHAESHRS